MNMQMRTLSGADLIGKHAHPENQQQRPREGSRIREVYDIFMENRGQPVKLRFLNNFQSKAPPPGPPVFQSTILAQLRDIYGLEIVRVKKHTWMLIGEWHRNNIYVDYSDGKYRL